MKEMLLQHLTFNLGTGFHPPGLKPDLSAAFCDEFHPLLSRHTLESARAHAFNVHAMPSAHPFR